MFRRNFLQLLAAVPFVGKLVIRSKPDTSNWTGSYGPMTDDMRAELNRKIQRALSKTKFPPPPTYTDWIGGMRKLP